MIVVIGTPAGREGDGGLALAGLGALTALAAARAGARAELVGRAGEDPAGERLTLELARFGVGHAALLRDPAVRTPVVPAADAAAVDVDSEPLAPPTVPLEPADVELALRYLPDVRVVVVADSVARDVLEAAAAAASFADAVLVVACDREIEAPEGAIVIERPADDPDGTFAAFLGAYAAALDVGTAPDAAMAEVAGRLGWERAGDG